jgi:hypothetical protein
MPNNAKKSVYKEKEFGIYVLWRFLPPHFRGMKESELNALGFTDPLILKIIKIKNQTGFAKYFHIKDLGTLTDWNNKIKKENITSPFLTSNLKKELWNLNEKIILPNIDKLKIKISEQNKIISSLKKENALLKRKIELHTQEKPNMVPDFQNNISAETNNNISPVTPQTNINKKIPTDNIIQKLKKIFRK